MSVATCGLGFLVLLADECFVNFDNPTARSELESAV
ncbi:hypothetical protein GGR17_001546 [Confluentimicrobium naphthalenivorans]|uniref:Uncharacterized protein n=1 Tax=Actibacterium naphthalenivorans TaxID=1614693 RepID=A0A840C8J7_9RHOB|nr:hypothetical protein [Actibacterium naphthalenivorans]